MVLGTVLVLHGRMDMNQRGCKYSDQERCTKYYHASSSHKPGMLFDRVLGVNYRGFSETRSEPSRGTLPHGSPR